MLAYKAAVPWIKTIVKYRYICTKIDTKMPYCFSKKKKRDNNELAKEIVG